MFFSKVLIPLRDLQKNNLENAKMNLRKLKSVRSLLCKEGESGSIGWHKHRILYETEFHLQESLETRNKDMLRLSVL